MRRVLTCLGMMSVLVLTLTVSSGFVSNGYHKAYARVDLDPLGTKIRESINNQITEELSGSAGQNPSSSSGSSSLSPSSGSSGLTTPSPSESPTPTILTLSASVPNMHGTLKTNSGSAIANAIITYTYKVDRPSPEHPLGFRSVTNLAGDYSTLIPTGLPAPDCLPGICIITAHYAGDSGTVVESLSKSDSPSQTLHVG
jgi:hypothetical protein